MCKSRRALWLYLQGQDRESSDIKIVSFIGLCRKLANCDKWFAIALFIA